MPKRRFHLDTSRFDSVLEAEIDADRAIDRMDDEELVTCPACNGSRLNPVAASVRLGSFHISNMKYGMPVAELARMTISRAVVHFSKLAFTESRQQAHRPRHPAGDQTAA